MASCFLKLVNKLHEILCEVGVHLAINVPLSLTLQLSLSVQGKPDMLAFKIVIVLYDIINCSIISRHNEETYHSTHQTPFLFAFLACLHSPASPLANPQSLPKHSQGFGKVIVSCSDSKECIFCHLKPSVLS